MLLRRVIFGSAVVAILAPISSAFADDTGLATIHDLRRERGRLCMSDHYHDGSGYGPTQKAALRDAVGSWAGFTDLEYGSDWARWGKAASKTSSCSKTSSGYECSVSARPCK
jgi:hypothetical protein